MSINQQNLETSMIYRPSINFNNHYFSNPFNYTNKSDDIKDYDESQ
jgi:hypothetical protein